MVARTPPKQRRQVAAPLNPVLVRETLKKVEKSIARLQELQYTVTGGNKVIGGVSLSPRSTRGYLRTSLRCKQESLRIGAKKSPVGKLPASSIGEWRRMSLPAMLLGETMGEILQASQFARELIEAVENKTKKHTLEDPKTPMPQQRKQRSLDFDANDTELRSKRKKEKQNKLPSNRSESSGSPSFRRARSRINFKVSSPKKRDVESGGSPSFRRVRSGINVKVSPPKKREVDKENCRYLANKVSPRHKPWAKKTVLFPNPLFLSTDSMQQQQKFCRTRSPVIARTKQTTPHKFLIKSPKSGGAGTSKFQAIKTKSPPLSVSKFQVKLKSPRIVTTLSPTRASLSRKSPKVSTTAKLRRSFSPSRLANRLVSLSPLKTRKNVQSNADRQITADRRITGLKQRPAFVAAAAAMPRRFSLGRI